MQELQNELYGELNKKKLEVSDLIGIALPPRVYLRCTVYFHSIIICFLPNLNLKQANGKKVPQPEKTNRATSLRFYFAHGEKIIPKKFCSSLIVMVLSKGKKTLNVDYVRKLHREQCDLKDTRIPKTLNMNSGYIVIAKQIR